MSRSTTFHARLIRFAYLLCGLSAAATASAPDQALAAGSSRFAGCYGAEGLIITVSGSGRISDANDYVKLTGRIWDDGYMELTYTRYLINFDRSRGPRGSTYTITADAYGALDADGNLYGVLEWSTGEVSSFLWLRCE